MHFTEAMAHLSVGLHEPLFEFTELRRAMREGSRDLVAVEKKLAREASAEHGAIDWGEDGFRDLLRGQPGPGRGLQARPLVLAYVILGYLLDCPRHLAAEQALAIAYAAPRDHGVCPKTGERLFLPALAKVFADADVFAQCADISVSADLGLAYIDFVQAGETSGPAAIPEVRSVFVTPAYAYAPSGSYGAKHLYPFTLRPLFALLHAKSAPVTRTGKRRFSRV